MRLCVREYECVGVSCGHLSRFFSHQLYPQGSRKALIAVFTPRLLWDALSVLALKHFHGLFLCASR